ncbi:winged helix-turn-helix transcriptional regulator [uncultured Oribacterium sp.]|uniref:MarR family winged helix-turn-helix transcriptional regulator n=1 Tax=uncultured Oribacterium sp. TaxID=462198 RepID=UPI0028040D8A|nr:winged helix-turn-helix transcriptional regulator [uncultured Oribacterium sp.]
MDEVLRNDSIEAIWKTQDEAYALMREYDDIPHNYGDYCLYQVEGEFIDIIAEHPDITMTEISELLNKTPSACSQIVRKLIKKELIVQIRDEKNNRKYKLRLTELGEKVYKGHQLFTEECRVYFQKCLEGFSEEELMLYVKIQKSINKAYQHDIQKGSILFSIPGFYQDIKEK